MPELAADESAAEWCARRLGVEPYSESPLPELEHAFTHFDLTIAPRLVKVAADYRGVMEPGSFVWHNAARSDLGIAAPIRVLLDTLRARGEETTWHESSIA